MNNHAGWTRDGYCVACGTDDAGAPCSLGDSEPEAEHASDCGWWKDWHDCSCGAFDREK